MTDFPNIDVTVAIERLADEALRTAMARRGTPVSTYRLQFRKEFTFEAARLLVPYLHDLGITHLYASPFLKARPGSHHGYDVIDHSCINPEVGTEAEFEALVRDLRERGMGLILDVVPNHMCIAGDNAWWADVLEHGPSSPYAEFFDIAWFDSPRPGMRGRLLLPVLGDSYGKVLESGLLKLTVENGLFSLQYYETRLPIDPRTYGHAISPAVAAMMSGLSDVHPDTIELASILNAIAHLPSREEADPSRLAMGRVEIAAMKRRLRELPERFPQAANAIADAVKQIAGTPGDPASFAPLDDWLELQAYRPCFWRVASDEINYRRFFDVNELAALATERDDVFRAVHRKCFEWLAEGLADGVRIDHPDGLYDPKQYLDRLQAHYLLAVAKRLLAQDAGAYAGIQWERDEAAILERLSRHVNGGARPLYVVVEKILSEGETVPTDWACDGATGYKFLNAVNNLFVDPAGEQPLTKLYREILGSNDSYAQVVYEKKSLVLATSLASELNSLAYRLDRLARLDRRSRDFTLAGLRTALREVIANFSVYRSFVTDRVHDTDKAAIGKAIRRARRNNPMLGAAIFEFIRDTLLLKDAPSGPTSDEYRALQKRFVGTFQQLTAPVTAKGVEDTAFYHFNRLLSLNEVGGEPGRWGWTPDRVHGYFADRAAKYPGGMSPLSTHDTKRSEDVRARLNVLSEIPDEWARLVHRWMDLNAAHKTELEDGVTSPDANEEYAMYQTLVGIWPAGSSDPPSDTFRERIRAHALKALREAKVHSSWINPDQEYENAATAFVDRILDPNSSAAFLTDLQRFVDRIAPQGWLNGLSQTVLRCTAPGVPDSYQGTEAWDYSLVDPDNRRAVDYASRTAWLHDVEGTGLPGDGGLADPRAKVFTTARLLRLRRNFPTLFREGNYVPLAAEGEFASRVFCFLRTLGTSAVLVVVPRLTVGLGGDSHRLPFGREVWGETAIALPDLTSHATWTNAFTGCSADFANRHHFVADLLGTFPVAVWTATVEGLK